MTFIARDYTDRTIINRFDQDQEVVVISYQLVKMLSVHQLQHCRVIRNITWRREMNILLITFIDNMLEKLFFGYLLNSRVDIIIFSLLQLRLFSADQLELK